jgi:diguanylate cyclase (GGDEF)-like protein
MQAVALDSDSLGRYGGEEFIVVLYPCAAEGVSKPAERLRSAIAGSPFTLTGSAAGALQVTISLGTSSTTGPDDSDVKRLLKRADDALYRSKAGGRNRVTIG